jgi:hypothetical protein
MNRLDRHQQAIELAKTPVPYSHSMVAGGFELTS